jgi:uncharacterized protein YwbE
MVSRCRGVAVESQDGESKFSCMTKLHREQIRKRAAAVLKKSTVDRPSRRRSFRTFGRLQSAESRNKVSPDPWIILRIVLGRNEMSESTVCTVIFYERHGSKRKPKYDGTLTIQTPSCHVTLKSNEDSCSQDECEVSSAQQDADQENPKEHSLSKKCHKKSKDSLPTGLLFSGKCPEMQKKFAASSALAVDDIVVISKWECQIMSIDSDGSKSGGGGGIMSKSQTEGKRSAGIVPKTQQTEGKVISGIVKRIPSLLNSSPSKKEATKQLKQLPGPNREPFQRKRKILPENTMDSSSDKQQPPESVTFSGAIIPIEIPHSIKVSLRPHQVEGVEFLWNAITGSSPSMQKLKQERTKESSTISDEAWNGAILGDIMGSGKTLMTIALLCGLFRRDRRKVRTKFLYMVNLFPMS